MLGAQACGAMRLTAAACLLLVYASAASGGAVSGGSGVSEFRIRSPNGTECVDADLTGAVFALPYRCRGNGSGVAPRLCTARVALPGANGTRVAGRCGNRTAQLDVAWATFRLEMLFKQRTFQTVWAQVKTETVTYSYLADMRLSADLRDSAFVNASIEKGESPLVEFWRPEKERSLLLFAAPARSAFVCRSPEQVRLRAGRRDGGGGGDDGLEGEEAVATFPSVRLAMSLGDGGVEKSHDGDFLCEADSKRHRTGIAALVFAGVIGVCMLVIVIGYLVTRLNKNSRYSNME